MPEDGNNGGPRPWYMRPIDVLVDVWAAWWDGVTEKWADGKKWLAESQEYLSEFFTEFGRELWTGNSSKSRGWAAQWCNKWRETFRQELKDLNTPPKVIEAMVGKELQQADDGAIFKALGIILAYWFVGLKARIGLITRHTTLRENAEWPIEPLPPGDSIIGHRRLKIDGELDLAKQVDPQEEMRQQGYSEGRVETMIQTSWTPLPMNEVLRLWHAGDIDDEELERQAVWNNLDPKSRKFLHAMAHTALGVGQLHQLLWRGHISREEFQQELAYAGLDDKQRAQVYKLGELIPGPSDLVRFSVREAFDPAYIARFGTLDQFPEEFADAMAKQGYNREWSERFWIAHWELPGLNMGFEMFHRDIITREELDGLMHALDIMPWWRPKLMAMAYKRLTRVDIRRMHKLGILDYEATVTAYRHGSYSPEDAVRMADFTVEFNARKEKDLTKAELLGAYERGLMSGDEVTGNLKRMGYDDAEVSLLLMRITHKLYTASNARKTTHIRKLYYARQINEAQALERLTAIPLDGREATTLVDEWHAERIIKEIPTVDEPTLPSKSDVTKFVNAKIIGETTFKATLSALGYVPGWIDVYWQSLSEETRNAAKQFDADKREGRSKSNGETTDASTN